MKTIRGEVIAKYKKDRYIRDDYQLDEDEEYFVDQIVKLRSNVGFTENQVINFAKYVWYTKDIKDPSKGLVDFFEEWLKMGKNYH